MGGSIWSEAIEGVSAQVEHSIDHVAPAGKRDIQVDKDNVLKVAKTIQDIAEENKDKVGRFLDEVNISPPGGDLISGELAEAWQERLVTNHDSHANRINEYFKGLIEVVDKLKVTAKTYGYTDEEISEALRAKH